MLFARAVPGIAKSVHLIVPFEGRVQMQPFELWLVLYSLGNKSVIMSRNFDGIIPVLFLLHLKAQHIVWLELFETKFVYSFQDV